MRATSCIWAARRVGHCVGHQRIKIKRVFQLYWVATPKPARFKNRRFGRDELIVSAEMEWTPPLPPGKWARLKGPQDRTASMCRSGVATQPLEERRPQMNATTYGLDIRPFVQTNKTDGADAQAIWTEVQQPGLRTAAVKTEAQQAMPSLHRMRSLLVKFRTTQSAEFIVSAVGGKSPTLQMTDPVSAYRFFIAGSMPIILSRS